MTDVRPSDCPSPDCGDTAGGSAAFLEHVSTDHPGEDRRDDGPDTAVGRASRAEDDEEE